MKLTVAICTYNRQRYLPQLFESIKKQHLAGSEFEILVINNNSTDKTEEICKQFSAENPSYLFRYFIESNQGLSYARNRAIQKSKCEYITFLDDDAFIDTMYLSTIIELFETDNKIMALGGKILLHYEDSIPTWENKYLNSLMGFYDKGNASFVYNGKGNDYPRGSNMAFRMSIFNEVGNFDITLGRVGGNLMGGEEKEIFGRIFDAKKFKVLYSPNLIVFHSVPNERTTKDFIVKQAYQTGQSERLRSKAHRTYLRRLLIEVLKWIVSLGLWLIFLLKGRISKGNMIIVFRWWVSRGILKK